MEASSTSTTTQHKSIFAFKHSAHWFGDLFGFKRGIDNSQVIRKSKVERSKSGHRTLLHNNHPAFVNNHHSQEYQRFHERLGLESLPIFKERNQRLLMGWGQLCGLTKDEATALSDAGIQVASLPFLTVEVLTDGGSNGDAASDFSMDDPKSSKLGFNLPRPLAQSIYEKIQLKYKLETTSNARGSFSGTMAKVVGGKKNPQENRLNKKEIRKDQKEYKDIVLNLMSNHFTNKYNKRVEESKWSVQPNSNYISTPANEYRMKPNSIDVDDSATNLDIEYRAADEERKEPHGECLSKESVHRVSKTPKQVFF